MAGHEGCWDAKGRHSEHGSFQFDHCKDQAEKLDMYISKQTRDKRVRFAYINSRSISASSESGQITGSWPGGFSMVKLSHFVRTRSS